MTMISIVFSNISFVLIRTCKREIFSHEFKDLARTDTKQDYVATMETQFMVNILAQFINNVLIHSFIERSVYVASEFYLESEPRVFEVQYGMQLAQLICVLVLVFTPLRPHRHKGWMCWWKTGPVVHWCLA